MGFSDSQMLAWPLKNWVPWIGSQGMVHSEPLFGSLFSAPVTCSFTNPTCVPSVPVVLGSQPPSWRPLSGGESFINRGTGTEGNPEDGWCKSTSTS